MTQKSVLGLAVMVSVLGLGACSSDGSGNGGNGGNGGDGGAGGTGGAGVDSGPPAPTFQELSLQVLRSSCAAPLCHSYSAQQGALPLDGPDLNAIAQDYLIDQPAAGEACGGIGFTRVVPGDPETSLLYMKLFDTAPCGDRMPVPPPPPLPDEDIELIRLWIEAGAPLE